MNKTWEIREATLADDKSIRDLLKNVSQEGLISLGFEREPSYFSAISVSYNKPEIYVYEDLKNSQIIGMFSAGLRNLYINGKPELVRYTGDLRIHPDHQGTRVMFRMIKTLKSILGKEGWAHTVILSDNQKSLDTVSKARAGMPQYFHHTTFHTYTIPPQRRLIKPVFKSNINTRPALASDIIAMQKFFDDNAPKKQFFPCYDLSKLDGNGFYNSLNISNYQLAFSGNKIVGLLGLWNQEQFKQTRVIGYKYPVIRLINNFILRGVKLPKKGATLSYEYVHTILIADNKPDILSALLHSASHAPSYSKNPIVIGLDSKDPLNCALTPLRKLTLKSEHFLTTYADNPPPLLSTKYPYTYPEVARL